MDKIKLFCGGDVELREATDARKKSTISGYGIRYYDGTEETEYSYNVYDGWTFRERILKGALDQVISNPHDVRSFFNHDPNYILGRTKSGTMRLELDDKGLRYEVDPPKTTAGNDVIESIKRGDVSGASFMFKISDGQKWIEDSEAKTITREISRIDELFEVGPVVFPAYQGADSHARKADELEKRINDEIEKNKREKEKEDKEKSELERLNQLADLREKELVL